MVDLSVLRERIMKKLFAAFIFAICLCFSVSTQTSTDSSLRGITALDEKDRDENGNLMTLTSAEHITRGFVYLDNQHFPEAQAHFLRFLDVNLMLPHIPWYW